MFGASQTLFLICEAALLFAIPIVVSAWVGSRANDWEWPKLAVLAVPLTYFSTLLVNLIFGVNAGLLVP